MSNSYPRNQEHCQQNRWNRSKKLPSSKDYKQGLKLMSFNCRSIRNKTTGILTHLSERNVDIAFLQETWLKKSDGAIISEIKEYGYHTMMFSKPRKNWGGGVAIIYKSNLNVDRVPNKIKYKSFEHIECVIRTEREVFRVANIYRN